LENIIGKCDFRNIRKYNYSYFGRVLQGKFICYIYIIGSLLKDITTKGVERNCLLLRISKLRYVGVREKQQTN
jgi:hypothetical protein